MARYERVVIIPDIKQCRFDWNRKVAKIPIGTFDVDMSIADLNHELKSGNYNYDRRGAYDELLRLLERGCCVRLDLVKWLIRDGVILVAYIKREGRGTRMLIAMPAADGQVYKQVQVEDCERRHILGLLLFDLNKHREGFDGVADPCFEPVLEERQIREIMGDLVPPRKYASAAFYRCCSGAPMHSCTLENQEDDGAVQRVLEAGVKINGMSTGLQEFERACVAQMMYREFLYEEDCVDPQFMEVETPNKERYYIHIDSGRAMQMAPRVKFVNGGIFYETCRDRVMRMCIALIAARPRICEARRQSLALTGRGVASLADSCSLAIKRATVYWQDIVDRPDGCAKAMRELQCSYRVTQTIDDLEGFNDPVRTVCGSRVVHTSSATLLVCQDELYDDWHFALNDAVDAEVLHVFGVSHSSSLPSATELVKFDIVLIRESYFCREAMQSSVSPIYRIHWRRVILESPIEFNNWWRQTLGQVRCICKDILWIVGALGMQGITKRRHRGLEKGEGPCWDLAAGDVWDIAHFEPMEVTIAAMVEQGSKRPVTMDLWPGVRTRWVGEEVEIQAAKIERDLRALMPHYEPPVITGGEWI
ncbi:uncharacterized protein V1513DRAFT_270197 [Lipomyces chichibuensis]|uniref:uncharacterized protein n=1 Tax=Lipomyces chichibuensis TaxID=1546026 RepID=UPI003343E142